MKLVIFMILSDPRGNKIVCSRKKVKEGPSFTAEAYGVIILI